MAKTVKGMIYHGPNGGDSNRFDWWESNKSSVADDMLSTVRNIAQKQSYVRENNLWHARLHGGVQIAGLTPTAYSRPAVAIQIGEAVGLNVIENMCGSAQAEICQNKPKCTFATDAADFDMRQKAEKLDKFCEGQFYKVDLYEVAQDVFLDATIFGTGILKIFEDPATLDLAVERVFPWELYIDQADGLYGSPRCMYQSKFYDRTVLGSAYDSEAIRKKIQKAQSAPLTTGRDLFMYDTTADLVQVVEGWRLPSSKDAKDGRHVIAIDGAALVDEPWEQPEFPFAFLRWLKRPFGFWGKGLCEQLAGIQKEINRLLIKIQRAFARLGITRVYIERGSKVNPAHMRAMDGDIVYYTGSKPIQETPPSINPEIFSHLWQLENKAYQITGISQMTAQGQAPPPGVDSGRAIRAMLQNHSKRLIVATYAYEQFFLDVAGKMIRLARDISRREGAGYKVKFRAEAGYEEIDFKDIDLDEDSYVMKRYPTSLLPSNPGERLQTLQEMFNTGLIDGDTFQLLADFPDLKTANDMNPVIASYKAIMRKLTAIAKDGTPWTPDGYIDVDQALKLAVPYLLNAEDQHVPEERLELLRETIDELKALKNPPPPPGANGPAGPPGGQPGAPPGPDGAQLPPPGPGALPGQVAPIGPMANPMQPSTAA